MDLPNRPTGRYCRTVTVDTLPIKGEDKQTRRRDTARTVSALKRAARERLVSNGIAGLSIQPVLEAAGVSRGALFHHFPTKNHLIAAAFADLLEEAADQLHELGRSLRAGRISRSAFVEGIRDTFCSDLFIGSMEIALAHRVEPALRLLVDEAVETWWDALSRFWTDTFVLPPEVATQQHWAMASNLLRGHAFTSTYRALPEDRAAFCIAFEAMILADAKTRSPVKEDPGP